MLKKFSLLVLSIILFFGVLLPQDTGSAEAGSLTISTDSINVRSGPGLTYPLVKIANRGEKYSIVKEKDDWIEIKLSFGKTGWVVNWLVTKDNAQNTATSASSVEGGGIIANANTDQLRIRSGPGTSFPIVGFLNQGQAVTILDQNENWFKVTSTFGDGWVIRDFLNIDTGKVSDKQSTSTSTNRSETGTVNADTLNIRKSPSATSPVIGKLSKGTNVTIYSSQKNWVEIGYANFKGWVSSEFITSNTGLNKASSVKSLTGTVTASNLSVRGGPTLNSAIIGSVSMGQSFAILEENNNWVKVEFNSGKFGWIAGWYLTKTTTKTPQSSPSVSKNTVTILQNGTNIREKATVQSDVVQLANEGEVYQVIRIVNDWYELKLKNGKTGFVAGWIVSSNGSSTQIQKSGAESYLKNKTIVLDPGHGGGDNGTTGANGTLEKNLTLRTARLLYDKLIAAGANVILTRSSDSFIALPSRVNAAESNNADAFISLHYDSNLNHSIRGMTGYYYHIYQKSLAETLFASTVAKTKLNDRGVRIGDFHVIRENSQKAALIELGYLSNPEEEITLKSSTFQENAASGLYDGLARFFKNN